MTEECPSRTLLLGTASVLHNVLLSKLIALSLSLSQNLPVGFLDSGYLLRIAHAPEAVSTIKIVSIEPEAEEGYHSPQSWRHIHATD